MARVEYAIRACRAAWVDFIMPGALARASSTLVGAGQVVLLEHDAKALLAQAAIPVPAGYLVEVNASLDPALLPRGPWIVKAQVPAGGRGKAGLVRSADSETEVRRCIEQMLGQRHRGHTVSACRVETRHVFAREVYLGYILEPETGDVRVLVSERGGVDIETSGAVRSTVAAPRVRSMVEALDALCAKLAPPERAVLCVAGRSLAQVFVRRDAMMLEINPLFVLKDGGWLAGDAKLVIDDNAIARQSEVAALLRSRAHAYVETNLKFTHGFDYVVVDPEGELGLLTTGAGLSMMLIDELRAAGIRAYNFLDVRTGGLRGDASRLVQVLDWISQGRNIKCVLVNVFAGITDLGEFARLLVEARERAQKLKVPMVTRLVGNGLDEARKVLGNAGIAVEPDLNRALALVRTVLERSEGGPAR
jgi:succinyl-CoA synthetase beta subunit